MIEPRLQGRVALVTGANHGIGAAIVDRLRDQGAQVVGTYLPLEPDAALGRVVGPEYDEARARRIDAPDAIEADLSDASVINALFDRAESLSGPVEILVHHGQLRAPAGHGYRLAHARASSGRRGAVALASGC